MATPPKPLRAITGLGAALVVFSACSIPPRHNYVPRAGYVPDAATAIRIAEAVWTPIYGERELRSQRPFRAELRGNVWRVHGTLPQPSPGFEAVGGTAAAEIDRRTGKILLVSHGE